MWPVMTLTLLLQLTDEEQLYAQAAPEPATVTTDAPIPQDTAPALEVSITADQNG